jgi:hypothetical protein
MIRTNTGFNSPLTMPIHHMAALRLAMPHRAARDHSNLN